jgi:hypothetical protein
MIEPNKYKWLQEIERSVLAYAYLEMETELRMTRQELASVKGQLREALQKAYGIKVSDDKPEEQRQQQPRPNFPPRPQQPPQQRPPMQQQQPRPPAPQGQPKPLNLARMPPANVPSIIR